MAQWCGMTKAAKESWLVCYCPKLLALRVELSWTDLVPSAKECFHLKTRSVRGWHPSEQWTKEKKAYAGQRLCGRPLLPLAQHSEGHLPKNFECNLLACVKSKSIGMSPSHGRGLPTLSCSFAYHCQHMYTFFLCSSSRKARNTLLSCSI